MLSSLLPPCPVMPQTPPSTPHEQAPHPNSCPRGLVWQVVEVDAAAAQWADDFQRAQPQQRSHMLHQQQQGGGSWAEEFNANTAAAAARAQGISEPAADWADQFARGVADLTIGGDDVAGLQEAWNQVRAFCLLILCGSSSICFV